MKIKAFALIILVFVSVCVSAQTELYNKLKNLSNVVSVKKMEVKPFKEYYEIYFRQNINHNDPSKGQFNQRVLLGHKAYDKPVVAVLEGYKIWSAREGELSRLFDCNQLIIEHRFFKNSKPEGGIPWESLKITQAAEDQHIIINELKKIYGKSKWITTGISKGGQTTIMHRYFYPNDVDISVPYVAPQNLDREDTRIHKFLKSVGTKKCRKKVFKFQKECFKHIDEMLSLMQKYSKRRNYTFNMVGNEKRVLELCILEYSFAFWQWGNSKCEDIPDKGSDVKTLFNHLVKVSGPSFFEDKGIKEMQPFFWAALTEMGMYSYEIAPFKRFLNDKKDITFDFTLPDGYKSVSFDNSYLLKIYEWLRTDADRILFIYGGLDTWSATAAEIGNNSKCKKYVLDSGHHGTRIRSFDEQTKKEIIETLSAWIKK
jgi:hypothetical protein